MIRLAIIAFAVASLATAAPALAKPHATSNDVINACTHQADCEFTVMDDGEVIGSTDQGTFHCTSGGEQSVCGSIPRDHPKKPHQD